MSRRLPNYAPGRILLPVSRYDIADYLGISAETVSRSLSGLNQRGIISFKGKRQVSILNSHALDDGYRAAARGIFIPSATYSHRPANVATTASATASASWRTPRCAIIRAR